MRLYLAVVSATPELFLDATDFASAHAEGPITILGVGNGCDLGLHPNVVVRTGAQVERVELDRLTENVAVPRAFDALYRIAAELDAQDKQEDSVVCYIHDDVRMLEAGWDRRVVEVFEGNPRVGLAGFGGTTALGSDDIYKSPYHVFQLGRHDFHSNMIGAEQHGARATAPMSIVATDGFSMIVRRSLLDKAGGWSWWPPHCVHHAYDYGIACMARRYGYAGQLVPVVVDHRGGLTACTSKYQDMARTYGGDAVVHDASHRFVYEEFRDVLPLRLP